MTILLASFQSLTIAQPNTDIQNSAGQNISSQPDEFTQFRHIYTRRASARQNKNVPNTDSEDIDSIASISLTTPNVLKNVVIPASRSSLGSSLSSLHDRGSESETTPLTSVAVTPAEQLPKAGNAVGMHRINASVIHATQVSASGKRKRMTAENLAQADVILAQSLQEHEWGATGTKFGSSKRRRTQVLDSEEDLDMSIIDATHGLNDSSDEEPLRAIPDRHRRHQAPSLRTPVSNDDGDDDDDESDLTEESVFDPDQDATDFEDSQSSENDDGSGAQEHMDQIPEVSIAPASGNRAHVRPAAVRRRRDPRQPRRQRQRPGGFVDRATRERRKLEKAHPEILTMWDELEALPKIVPAQIEQPTSITRKLKSFQLEGVDWMIKQERSQWKGGLLGDEMGMGKTIQAVSLIMSDYPAKDPTLVVVPPVALMQWQSEVGQYTDGKLKILIYHNTNPKVKGMTVKDLRGYDVIMISYAGLESIYRKESKGWKRDEGLVKENSKIHALHFHRVLLDEAHSIKTRTTSVAKACFALKANFKWCLSGTPVQNRIGEFFSLLRYLQVAPFASYLCKKCPCSRLHWDQDGSKRCTSCKHTGLEHVSAFNQEILNPIIQQGDADLRREGLRKLRLITDRIMLRRLKRDHTASMELPPKDVIIHNEFFGEIERDFSTSIMSNTNRQFDTYVSRGVMLNNYANIFGLIMQVSNRPCVPCRSFNGVIDASSGQPSRSHSEKTCRRRSKRTCLLCLRRDSRGANPITLSP